MTFSRASFVFIFLLATLAKGVLPLPAFAQAAKKDTPGESAKMLEDVRIKVARGRTQLNSNQDVSIETLRAASQQSLDSLTAFLGTDILIGSSKPVPQTGFWATVIRQATEAHYWWGRAADQFGRRDEAIEALARASRLVAWMRPSVEDSLPRDTLLAFGGALRDGLPLVAKDDTLTTVAEIAHGKLWAPRRFEMLLPETKISFVESRPQIAMNREFLMTSGRVYPPVPTSTVDASAALSRVPPIHRTISAEALPGVLRLDRMVVGFVRETSGPDEGSWRQVVQVFYPSPFLTRERRDDGPRAEALCAQFLKVHALFENAMNLRNPYVRNDVTTLWLSEVSALWPSDDVDPRVRESLGIMMPRINTPTKKGQADNREIDVDPLSYPWRAGARKTDSAPGDILFLKLTQPRDEAEWLRETFHEYGHVALPALGNFKPPLEPFANGLIGETLGMMWAANAPDGWKPPTGNGVPTDSAKFAQSIRSYVAVEAIPAMRFWKARGPISPLRRDVAAPGWQYLQGLSVYVERVYGANVLGAAFSPLIPADLKNPDSPSRQRSFSTESLMTALPGVLNDPFSAVGIAPEGVLPVWLPGAVDGLTTSTEDFVARKPLKLKAGQRITGWLYVPARAGVLHLEWKTASLAANSLQGDAAWKMSASKSVFGFSNAANFDVKTRPGWQRFNFVARADLELAAAQFEKSVN